MTPGHSVRSESTVVSPISVICGIVVCMGAALTFEEAYEKWAPELTRYAAGLAGPSHAADVVGDTFIVMLSRGEVSWSSLEDPRRYLYRAVTNTARMRERSQRRRRDREARWSADRPVGELVGNTEVVGALAALSVRQRAAVFLTYWEDLTPAAVAGILEISEGSVKRHLARARHELRKVLS